MTRNTFFNRKTRLYWRKYHKRYEIGAMLIIAVVVLLFSFNSVRSDNDKPIPTNSPTRTPTILNTPKSGELESPTVSPTPLVHPDVQEEPVTNPSEYTRETPAPTKVVGNVGIASYYSRQGCIGCRKDRIMANGEPLDDSALTVAYNRAPLNSDIKITNLRNGKSVKAKVSDTGGFENHGKIIDLSVATKEALGCGDVCRVKINHL